MSAVILPFASHARRALRRESEVIGRTLRDEWADNAYREVLKRCDAKKVPRACSMGYAQTAANTVRRGHESSGAITRAVERATKYAFPDGPDAA